MLLHERMKVLQSGITVERVVATAAVTGGVSKQACQSGHGSAGIDLRKKHILNARNTI